MRSQFRRTHLAAPQLSCWEMRCGLGQLISMELPSSYQIEQIWRHLRLLLLSKNSHVGSETKWHIHADGLLADTAAWITWHNARLVLGTQVGDHAMQPELHLVDWTLLTSAPSHITSKGAAACHRWSPGCMQGSGLSPQQAQLCDAFVYIPQYGAGTASLNVTVAASIVLQHFAVWAGYPERPRTGEKYKVGERPQRTGPRGAFLF